MKTCENCGYIYPDEPTYWPLAGVNRCKKCMGTEKKPKKTEEDKTCDMCRRIKPHTKFSAELGMKWNKNICYLCAKRAGTYKPQKRMRCLTCGLIKPVKMFPADYLQWGNYCKGCIKSGKYKIDSIKQLNPKTPEIAV